MLRTIGVLLLLLGLVTATPVVCLCVPIGTAVLGERVEGQHTVAPQTIVGERASLLPDRAGLTQPFSTGPNGTADTSGLLASSAVAVVALLLATAASLPPDPSWRLPWPRVVRLRPLPALIPFGPAPAPTVPPPR